jgi:protein-S-isoprenylcysteine O-methyltransferase Ste14
VNRWPACGVLSYAIFFSIFLYAIGFVGPVWVPKSIESARVALLIDVGLLGLFAIRHSVMAGPAFKRWWTHTIPERG